LGGHRRAGRKRDGRAVEERGDLRHQAVGRIGGVVGQFELELLGHGEQRFGRELAAAQRGLVALRGGEGEHFRAERGRAVGDGQPDEIGLARPCKVRVDLDRGEQLLPALFIATSGSSASISANRARRVSVLPPTSICTSCVRSESTSPSDWNGGSAVTPGYVRGSPARHRFRVVGLRRIEQPLAVDGPAIGGGAFDGDAEETGLGH
jgi:hypothetical protein